MGGRGASSGMSHYERKNGTIVENPYGSQYRMVHKSGNIKFVSRNARESEPLMETMTKGRVYAHVEGDTIRAIVYFDKENKRSKQIDLTHSHNGKQPHTHRGYLHGEYDSAEKRLNLTPKEQKMVDRVISTWNNRNRGK